MQIGDRVRFKPSVFAEEASVAVERQKPKAPTVEGTVWYIHPERRFYIVEYKVNGHTLRQTLFVNQR